MNNYTVVQKPSLLIAGIECRTSNQPEAGPQDISRHWERFYREDILNQIPHKASKEVIALYCDYEGDYTQPYSLVIGCLVSSLDGLPKGLVAKSIPASSYAVFHALGKFPACLIERWKSIWQQAYLRRTYTGDFEVYGDNFFSGSPPDVAIYIAIEKEDLNEP